MNISLGCSLREGVGNATGKRPGLGTLTRPGGVGWRVRSPPRRGPPPGDGARRRGETYASHNRRQIQNIPSGTDVGIGSFIGARRGAFVGSVTGTSGLGRVGVLGRAGRAGRPRRVGRLVFLRRAGLRRGCGAGAGNAPALAKTNGKDALVTAGCCALGGRGSRSATLRAPVSESRPRSGSAGPAVIGGTFLRREPRSVAMPVARFKNTSDSLLGVPGSSLPRGRRKRGRM